MKPIPKPNIVTVLEELGGEAIGSDNGGWRKARCPIHEDNSPSASVNEDECRFNCFACDFNGDAVDLIMEVTGAGWNAAVKRAEGLAGDSDRPVRAGRRPSQGLSARSGNRQTSGQFVPPWRLL